MKLSALRALIAAGESLMLELKKSTAEKDRACRTLCAMANGQGGQGGQVVFGVTPAGKLRARAQHHACHAAYHLPAPAA